MSEFLNPVWWVPPEGLKMLLVKQRAVSLYESVYCMAISTERPDSSSARRKTMGSVIGVLDSARCLTYAPTPSSNL